MNYKNIGIKSKLIVIFTTIKIVPLLIIVYMAINGINMLNDSVKDGVSDIFEESTKAIDNTAKISIEDSIVAKGKIQSNCKICNT